MKLKEWHIIVLIYVVTLGIVLYRALSNDVISDQAQEYNLYLQYITSGKWHYISDSLVNSSLITVYVPALIQRVFNFNVELWFKIYPCFLYATMPIFVYLLARKYFNKIYSLLPALLIMSNYYILYSAAIGRVSIAWAFLAGMLWAYFRKRYILFAVLGLLLIFTHYGTAFIAIGIFMALFILILFLKKSKKNIVYGILVLVLIVSALLWNFAIAKTPGEYGKTFVLVALNLIPVEVATQNVDDVKSEALGATINELSIPQVMEFVLNWVIVVIILCGLLFSLRENAFEMEYTIVALMMFLMITITVFSPYISVYYGISRVYFTALPILALYFAYFFKYVFQKYQKIGLTMSFSIILLYGGCVSGLVHRMFGIIK